MNLLAKREHEVPAALEKVFPGMDELVRSMFGRMVEPGSGLLRGSVFDSKWETGLRDHCGQQAGTFCSICRNGITIRLAENHLRNSGDPCHALRKTERVDLCRTIR